MSPQMLRESSPVAHKEHRCDGCRSPILPGQKYRRTTYITDDLYDWVQCSGCTDDNVSGWVFAVALWDDDGWCWDDAYTWATDTVHDQARPEAERQAAARWIERAGFEMPEAARRNRFKNFMDAYYAARACDLSRLEQDTALWPAEIAEWVEQHGHPMHFKRWSILSRGIPR